MIKQNELVPKRRFTGFFEEWRKKTLDEVLDLLKDGTHGTHQNVKDGVYLLSAKNIKNGKVNFDKSDRQISMDEYRRIHRSFELKKGDILLTVVGSIGESAILKNKEKLTFQRSVAYLRPKEEITSQYLFTNTNSLNFQKELKNRQVVSAQPGIYLGDLSIIPIVYPTLKEQQKIGQFFKHLDDMIALQQRKIDKTKALKSAYLAEMFPAEGEHVPKRRFEGFTESWRKSEFGDLTTIRRGLTYHPSSLSKTGVRVLRSSNINEDIFELRSDDVFVKNEAINIEKVKENDILITAANGSSRLIGKHALIKGIDTRTVHGGFMLLARSQEPYFINALMNASWYKDFIKVFVSGGNGSIGNIRKGDLENQVVFVPCEKEQQKIGQFFKHLDEMIATHQLKLDKLKATKQAYLHEMFV